MTAPTIPHSDWRSRPKVCKPRTGAANDRRYTGIPLVGSRAEDHDGKSLDLGECMWCHEPATRLCDTMLRGRHTNGDLALFDLDSPTCDAAVCEAHAESSTVYGHGDAGGWTDTIDACPYCQAHAGTSKGRNADRWSETHYISATLWAERVQASARKSKAHS